MSEPLLPDTTSDEREVGWGDETYDEPGDGPDPDEQRLRAERPPHHDQD